MMVVSIRMGSFPPCRLALGGALTSFERSGRSCGDGNEGSHGEKGREADEHLFKSGELNCLRDDGVLFC